MSNPFIPFFSGGNRSYRAVSSQNNTTFNYGFTSGSDFTGWIPLTLNDQGALRVDAGNISVSAAFTGGNVTVVNTAPIPVSGNFNTSVTVGDIAVTGGNINVNNFNVLTGQVAELQTAVNSLTGTVSSRWQKISTKSYIQQFTPITGRCLINKINIYSNYTGAQTFVQIFDGLNQVGVPDANLIVMGQNNAFYEFSDNGVEFNNGLTIGTSLDPVNIQTGDSSIFATVIYKKI